MVKEHLAQWPRKAGRNPLNHIPIVGMWKHSTKTTIGRFSHVVSCLLSTPWGGRSRRGPHSGAAGVRQARDEAAPATGQGQHGEQPRL